MNFHLPKQIAVFLLFVLLIQQKSIGQQVVIADDSLYVSDKPYALLELFSQNRDKGLLLPSVSSAERLSIQPDSSGTGLLLFDWETESFWYWDGNMWGEIARENGEILRISELIDGDDDTGVFVEKIEDENQIRFEVLGEEAMRVDSEGKLILAGSFQQGQGPEIKAIRQDSILQNSDTSLVTEGTIKRYLDANLPDSVIFKSEALYISVKELGVKGDGVTDDTDSLQAAIENHPGKTLFFPDGIYKAQIDITQPITLVSFSGNAKIENSEAGEPVLKVNAPCKLYGISFTHTENQPGSNGIMNSGQNIEAENCSFLGYENYIAPGFSTSTFRNCTFTVVEEGLGSLAWSPDAAFYDCTFDGVIGADVMDSKFYNCRMSGLWGVHMPEGAVDNAGNPTGYTGIAEFHNCEIKGSYYYAIGLGNRAHARMYNCTVIGHTSGAYARTESTYEAYNCYIECTKVDGGSTAVKFAKYITAEKDGIGLIDTGDSYFSQCTFVNSGSENGYHLIVPDKDQAGQVYLNNCNMSLQKTCTEDTVDVCGGDIYKYVTIQAGVNETPIQLEAVNTGDILTPEFSPGGVSFMDLSGDLGPASFLRISKTYGNDTEFPIGFMLIIRSSSDTDNITLRNGYYAPIGAGIVTLSGGDLTLNSNEFATFVYTKNFWVEVSSNSSAKNKSLQTQKEKPANLYLKQEGLSKDGKLHLDIPPGYRITSLVLQRSGIGKGGKLTIGTSQGGSDVLSAQKVQPHDLQEMNIKKNLFSLEKSQSLYIQNRDWASGKVNIYLSLQRIQ